MMRIKKILAIRVGQLGKLEQVELELHKLMRKLKSEFQKHYKKIYKNNKYGVEVLPFENKYLELRPVLPLLRHR